MGYVATRDTEALREWRSVTGAIPGPFETWLAHRSLATYPLRLERQLSNARALAQMLGERAEVSDVRYPGLGAVVSFTLASAAAAQRFLAACELVIEATSFGGLHSSAERRARWGTDDIAEGFIRFSCGIEDTEDLLADVRRGLDVLSCTSVGAMDDGISDDGENRLAARVRTAIGQYHRYWRRISARSRSSRPLDPSEMAKSIWVCAACGHVEAKWHGQCPGLWRVEHARRGGCAREGVGWRWRRTRAVARRRGSSRCATSRCRRSSGC